MNDIHYALEQRKCVTKTLEIVESEGKLSGIQDKLDWNEENDKMNSSIVGPDHHLQMVEKEFSSVHNSISEHFHQAQRKFNEYTKVMVERIQDEVREAVTDKFAAIEDKPIEISQAVYCSISVVNIKSLYPIHSPRETITSSVIALDEKIHSQKARSLNVSFYEEQRSVVRW